MANRAGLRRTLLTVGGMMALAGSASLCGAQAPGSPGVGRSSSPTISLGGLGGNSNTPNAPQVRTLDGRVMDANDKPVQGAQVYVKSLKNSNTLSVTTDEKGTFRFVALQKDVDYQFWAQTEQRRSDTKTISSFDGTMHITRSLALTEKAEKKADTQAGKPAPPK